MSSWYRSLYWRIAIGFLVSLAAMLVIQAVLFLWVASATGPTMPGQPPDRFAQTVASELAASLERDPNLDLTQYIRDQFGRDAYPFVVLLTDGRSIQNSAVPVPEPLLEPAREMLRRRESDGGPPPRPGLRRGGPGDPFRGRGFGR